MDGDQKSIVFQQSFCQLLCQVLPESLENSSHLSLPHIAPVSGLLSSAELILPADYESVMRQDEVIQGRLALGVHISIHSSHAQYHHVSTGIEERISAPLQVWQCTHDVDSRLDA